MSDAIQKLASFVDQLNNLHRELGSDLYPHVQVNFYHKSSFAVDGFSDSVHHEIVRDATRPIGWQFCLLTDDDERVLSDTYEAYPSDLSFRIGAQGDWLPAGIMYCGSFPPPEAERKIRKFIHVKNIDLTVYVKIVSRISGRESTRRLNFPLPSKREVYGTIFPCGSHESGDVALYIPVKDEPDIDKRQIVFKGGVQVFYAEGLSRPARRGDQVRYVQFEDETKSFMELIDQDIPQFWS